LPDDPRILNLMPRISDQVTVESDPPGAKVFLRRYLPNESLQPVFIGITPIQKQSVARGEYILSIEKEGYAAFNRTISSRLYAAGTAMLPPDEPTTVRQQLIPRDRVPPRMVFIPGGDYKLACWDKPTNQTVALGDYFIDQYEVTNREYREFILAGGYLRPQYWTHPFFRDGKTIAWEEAMREFKDRTGMPGPRNWSGQNFPEGWADHPVTEISWYEAAAYAAFRGKTLPTIFQWEKAARNGLFTYLSASIMPWGPIDVASKIDGRANFKSNGPRPVGSFEFGMSPFGAYDMAGNVAEWCLNETADGFITAGASWDDLAYLFGYVGSIPAFHRSNTLGFRCARNLEPVKHDPGAMKLAPADQVPILSPINETAYRGLLSHYRYDESPIKGTVVDAVETPEWRRERVSYTGGRDDRVIAYLYLPKNYPGPYQVIQFVPAGDVYGGYLHMTESLEMFFSPHIRSGRAVFAVVFRGFKERETAEGYPVLSSRSVKRREQLVANATDLRRGLDYLATRSDIDSSRIAYVGYSQGATEGLIYAAVEPRYRSVVFIAGGIWEPVKDALPENDLQNFAARIRAPKLLINGRFDEVHPFRTMIEPLYRILPQPKKLLLYDGSHTPPIEVAVPAVNTWLDETMGPIG
jgi:formylglycine-generating enzyme required for sulfatase activity/pimeloyl-ACP methyl ester carboxylesterase